MRSGLSVSAALVRGGLSDMAAGREGDKGGARELVWPDSRWAVTPPRHYEVTPSRLRCRTADTSVSINLQTAALATVSACQEKLPESAGRSHIADGSSLLPDRGSEPRRDDVEYDDENEEDEEDAVVDDDCMSTALDDTWPNERVVATAAT